MPRPCLPRPIHILFSRAAFFVILAGALLGCRNANAGAVPSLTLPEMVAQADIVCVGTTQSIKESGRAAVDTGVFNAKGKPLLVPADMQLATFAVEHLLKGKAADTIEITFPQAVPVAGANQFAFASLRVDETALVFLKRDATGKTLTLLLPASIPSPIIPLGLAPVAAPKTALTPFRLVVLNLVQAIASGDKTVQLDCLSRLQSINFLLYPTVGMFGISAGNRDIQTKIGETDAGLEQFVATQILPDVIKLQDSADAEVRTSAIITAAKLEDVNAIPRLVAMIKTGEANGSYATNNALRQFRSSDAVKPLIALLTNNNVLIRQDATFALREIGDPTTVPALLKQLSDSDAQVRQFALNGLYIITGEAGPARHADGSNVTEKEHLDFWKQWAATHPNEMNDAR